MKKDEGAKIMAVKYVLNYNTFRKSSRLKEDLTKIHLMWSEDDEFNRLFDKYCKELKESKGEMPLWARKIMAERYSLNV